MLWVTLSEIPLTFLTAVAAVAGSIVLGSYFHLIGYWPTDIPALFGLGIAVTLGLIAVLLTMSFAMQAPSFFARIYETEQLSKLEMAFSQFCAVALLCCYASSVSPGLGSLWSLGFGVLTCILIVPLIDSVAMRRKKRLSSAVSIAMADLGSLPVAGTLLAIVSTGATHKTAEWKAWGGLFVLLFVFIGVNALVAESKERQRGIWIVNLVLILLMLGWIPPRGFVSNKVAEIVGLRLKGNVELRVPATTCQTILSAVHLASLTSSASRLEGDATDVCRPWGNRVTAEVHVRLGSRWLLTVSAVNGRVVTDDSPRVTVPDLGTELLLLPTKRPNEM